MSKECLLLEMSKIRDGVRPSLLLEQVSCFAETLLSHHTDQGIGFILSVIVDILLRRPVCVTLLVGSGSLIPIVSAISRDGQTYWAKFQV